MPAIQKTSSVAPKTTQAAMSAERKAFWHSPYTNADAKVVKSKMGLKTIDAAKDVIGKAIIEKKETATLGKLGVTRALFDDQDCISRFKRSHFTDRDVTQAKKSFDFLKGASTKEVQSYLGLKLRNAEAGYNGGIEMLKENGIGYAETSARDEMAAFKSSGMTDRNVRTAIEKYDFLKNIPVAEVKQYLGLKVLNAKTDYKFAVDFLKDIGATKGWGK